MGQRDTSMLTFESSQTQGAAQIAEKLVVSNSLAYETELC